MYTSGQAPIAWGVEKGTTSFNPNNMRTPPRKQRKHCVISSIYKASCRFPAHSRDMLYHLTIGSPSHTYTQIHINKCYIECSNQATSKELSEEVIIITSLICGLFG